MKQIVLEKIVISPFPPINKRCLWFNGSVFNYWYGGAWRSIDSEIDINNEYIDEKVTEVVSDEITKVVGNAPEEYDTLGELAQYAAQHAIEAEVRDTNIGANTEAIKQLEEKIAAGGGGGIPSEWEGFEI